ncbi:MAG: response regulator transcription factor [Deltaproteobacteria bacterium]|nr:response regulator transcription factor [Deltaproteobacteria bacterium]
MERKINSAAGPRIMVVDDDPGILKVLRGNLELAGYEVETFAAGLPAHEAIRQRPPDLMILDLTLPDIDGVLLCRRLREEGFEFPVIMLTARDGLADKVLGLEGGGDDYMVKPFAFLELQARIKTCMRRKSGRGSHEVSEELRIGELTIDRRRRQVTVAGRQVELTNKEFSLLLLLAENRGRVLTREDIRKALWGKRQLYSWSRAIDVHIRHLRQKIEEDPEHPAMIHTVIGVGYRLEAE